LIETDVERVALSVCRRAVSPRCRPKEIRSTHRLLIAVMKAWDSRIPSVSVKSEKDANEAPQRAVPTGLAWTHAGGATNQATKAVWWGE